MPGPWVTTQELYDALGRMMHTEVQDLLPLWERIVEAAAETAAGDILQALLARGYTAAQVEAWDFRKVYNRDIALFWALTHGGGLSPQHSDRDINKLDRRKELATVLLLIGGVPVAPGGTEGVGVYGGRLSQDGYRIRDDTEF